MTKEELKDKYSAFIAEISEIMGLGKPIDILKLCATTDLFFRPLENRIAELEKDNAELKTKKIPELERKIASIRGCHKIDLIKLRARAEQVERLKKENAELKGLVNQYKASKCGSISLVNRNMIMFDQLTKAKELLKEFVHHYKAKTIYIENMQDLLEQAEQFIKDSEVEK